MATRVKECDLPVLLTALKQRLPLSVKLYGILRSYLEGKWPGQSFWVDRWPEFEAVAIIPIREQAPVAYHYIHCDNAPDLRHFIRHLDALDWNQVIDFKTLAEEVAVEIDALAQEKRLPVMTIPNMTSYKVDADDLVRLQVPDGVSAKPMTADDVMYATSLWKFCSDDTIAFVKATVTSFPSLCLRNARGDRIGHGLVYSHGMPGFVHVEPGFRGKGFGKIIVSQLSQMALREGWTPFVSIEGDNVASRALHASLGYRQVQCGPICNMVVGANEDYYRTPSSKEVVEERKEGVENMKAQRRK